jgi:hypothetical protein
MQDEGDTHDNCHARIPRNFTFAMSALTEIAARLVLLGGTVRNHLSPAKQKLGAQNRMEAARLAEQKGWLWEGMIAPLKRAWRCVQLALRNSWTPFLLARRARVIIHGSLQLATAPQRVPAGFPVFSACHAEVCGFVVADSVRGNGAGAPGKYLRCCAQDWPGARR